MVSGVRIGINEDWEIRHTKDDKGNDLYYSRDVVDIDFVDAS